MTQSRPSVPPSDDPRYTGFFDRFNRQRYFEAHEVLEPLWLEQRGRPVAPFYKGLIQIAGAFVHLQQHRPDPAARLLRLAARNLRPFAPRFARLDVTRLLRLIENHLARLPNGGGSAPPGAPASPPRLNLETT